MEIQYIFLVRQILIDEHLLIRIDEEGAFDSFEKAEKFMKSLTIDNCTLESDLIFRHEILKLPLNQIDDYDVKHHWIFSLDGQLLEEYSDTEEERFNFEKISFEGIFKKGEIVQIKSKREDFNSFSIKGDYGVVADCPVSLENWKKNGQDLEHWEGFYLLYYITDTGILDHQHLPEKCLKKLKSSLPEYYKFLTALSEYLKSNGNVENSHSIKEAIAEKIDVRAVKRFFKN